MTVPAPQPERTFLLKKSDGSRSTRFSISSPGSTSWSHITVQTTKEGGTSLALHAHGTQAPAATAREQKLSDRPGVTESSRAGAGAFDLFDSEGAQLATLRKNPMRSILRTTWDVRLADGSHAVGRETKPFKTLLRRLLMLAELVIDIPIRLNSGFVFRDPEGTLFSFESEPGANRAIGVAVAPRADERIALLQAALSRTR